MKETISNKQGLTNQAQERYSRGVPQFNRGGDNFMGAEPGQGEQPPQKPIDIDEATRRIEEAARRREQGEREKPQVQSNDSLGQEGNQQETPAGVGKLSFGQELKEMSNQGGFPEELQQFLREASVIPITTREQLEDIHRGFGNASNEAFSKAIENFGKESKKLFDEFTEKSKNLVGKELKDLEEKYNTERDALATGFRTTKDKLLDARKHFLNVLEAKYGSGKRGLNVSQQTLLDSIDRLKKASDSAETEDARDTMEKELRERVVDLSETVAPQDEPLPDEILIAIGKDAFATEKFLDKVIRLKQEDAQYHLPGFYSDINVNKFLRLNESLMDAKDMEHIQNLLRGTETLHEMNRILKTSVDQFAQISQTILPQHLTTVFSLPGVQNVFELYEGIIKENLSIETMITDDVFKQIDEQVEKEFREGVGKQILIGGEKANLMKSYKGHSGLEDWEVERALSYGRNLMRTLLREAEYISFSHIPEAQKAFISLAQGQLLGILNPVTYTQKRFKPGESHGGIEMLREFLDEAIEKRRHGRNGEASKGIVRIKELQGTSVEDREATKIINARGNIMTWRATEAILKEFTIVDNGQASNVTQFFVDHKGEIDMLKEISSNNAWDTEFERELRERIKKETDEAKKNELKDLLGKKDQKRYEGAFNDWKKMRVERVFGPLLENSAVGQGILVSSIPLTIPTEVREILWEKISDLNPDVMASLLTRLEVDGDAEGAEDLKGALSTEEIVLRHFGNEDQKRLLLGAKISDELRSKLSPEEIADPVLALLKKEDSLEQQIKTEKDTGRKEMLKKELQGIEESLLWKPRLVKKELDSLSNEEIIKLEVKLQDAKSQTEKDNLRAELAKKAPEYDLKKREFERMDREVKQLLRNDEWMTLRRKLRTINRLRMLDETERISKIKILKLGDHIIEPTTSPKKLVDYLQDQRLFEKDRLTDKETNVVDAISQNGRKISRDLANIQQANIWFLDDVPTDNIKWENLGQSFNRMIGDFGQFATAANEFNGFLFDPFKMSAEKAREHLTKTILAAGQVLGVEAVQDNLNSIVMTYNKWIRTDPKYDQVIINMIMSAQEKYTSKAQRVSRDLSALSLDEDAMHTHLLEQNHASILRGEKRDEKTGKVLFKDTFKKAEKELRADVVRRLLWANLKNYGPFFLIGMIISLLKGVTSKKE